MLAVSFGSIFVRYAQAAGAPSLSIAAWRLSLATLILLPPALLRQRAELRALPRRVWLWAGLSGVFLAIHFAAWISSLAYTSVASSVVFVSTSPLFVALIAAGLLHEKLARATLLGAAVALAGGAVIGLSDVCGPAGCPPLAEFLTGRAVVGDLLALAGAGAVAIYLLIGRRLRASTGLVPYILLTYGAAALTLLAAAVVSGAPLAGFPPQTYLWFVLLALIPQLIGHSAFNWALRYLPADFVSISTLGEPVGSTLLALALLGETPTPPKLLGGALILVGIFIAARPQPQAVLQSDPVKETTS